MCQKVKQADSAYIAGTYGRFDAVMSKGEGAHYEGLDGKRYIDFGTGIGVTLFGACDPDWVAAVTHQLTTLGHTSNLYYTEPQTQLAKLLCERTSMKKVFFGNSGAEANECALKVARKYGEKDNRDVIVTLVNSFHGRTIATLAATGQDRFHEHFGPFPAGFRYTPANDIPALEAILSTGKVCGLLMEMVQGEGGVIPLDPAFVKKAEELCHANDILLMVDEVQTGNGRTGTLYAYEQFGIHPDVVTTAKGLAGGLPMGACLLGERCEHVLGKGDHGSTFGGNPICAAAALNVISRLNEDVFAGVKERAAYIRKELTGAPGVKSITGLGLMIGILPEHKTAAEVASACLQDGLMVLTAHEKVRLLPPLNISYEDLAVTEKAESSADIRKRVQAARAMQKARFSGTSIFCNAQIPAGKLQQYCPMETAAEKLIQDAFDRLGLSARSYDRLLKVSRTIADLAGSDCILRRHMAAAIQYCSLSWKYLPPI